MQHTLGLRGYLWSRLAIPLSCMILQVAYHKGFAHAAGGKSWFDGVFLVFVLFSGGCKDGFHCAAAKSFLEAAFCFQRVRELV